MSFRRQVAAGFLWVALAQLAGRGLTFLTTLILARLLTPADFGLVGMAMLAINALLFFQDIGFEAALIYRRDDVEEASHTAFVTVLVSSALIFMVAFVGAPLAAGFFRQEALTPILRVLSLTIVISSFSRIPYVLLSRELDFRRRIIPELLASVMASGIAIVLAFRGLGVWSLVWRELIRATLGTVLVWFVSPYRPRLRFDPAMARQLYAYGKHIVLSQVLIFGITNIDNAVIGRYAGVRALGHYQFAYNLSNTPATQITSVVTQVMFPAFSRLAGGDPARLREIRAGYYMTLARYIGWITAPVAVATIVFAPAFIRTLYGPEWLAAIVPLQFLAIYGYIRSIAANMGSVFRAGGKPQWLNYIAGWRLATMALLLVPVTLRWGINGVSALSAAVAVVDFFISAVLVNRLVDAPPRAYIRALGPSLGAAIAAGALAFLLYGRLDLGRPLIDLLAAGAMLAAIYAGLLWLMDSEVRRAATRGRDLARRMWRERRAGHRTAAAGADGGGAK